MELSDIEKLLEKYFEGETTISEEQELKVYFTREIVSPHLEKYRSLFQYYVAAQDITIATNEDTDTPILKMSSYTWITIAASIAASIALVVGLFFTNPTLDEEELGTYDDPKVALQKTKEILNLVSQYMNEGKKDLVYLHEIENTKNKLIK